MTYLCWAALYEGNTDQAYFEILLTRVMEDIALNRATRNVNIPAAAAVILGKESRGVDAVAKEACAAKDAFHLLFIHADTGGAGQVQNLAAHSNAYCDRVHEVCDFSQNRCITITPCHETEAWVLADPFAVTGALGYNRPPQDIGLPTGAKQAEKLADPKAKLKECVQNAVGNRRIIPVGRIIPLIARNQSLTALRQSQSFQDFENRLVDAMIDLGCIN